MKFQPETIARLLIPANLIGFASLAGLLLTPSFLPAPKTISATPISSLPALSQPAIPIAYKAVQNNLRLVIQLSQRQVVLFQGNAAIKRYPIGVGKPGWETPTGSFKVIQKKLNPSWISPFTDEEISAKDPRNPLGGYWIGFWTNGKEWIGFHGTLDPNTIGRAASHGCIHMRRNDLKALFAQVRLGTPVKVVQ